MWRNWNPWALLVGMKNGATTMENKMEAPQKIKNRTTIWSSNPFSGYISEWIESRASKRYLHNHVHCSIIHNSQEVEAAQISIDRWMDKQKAVYTCNGIWIRHKKEGNSVICYTIDESLGHYAKWNKSQPPKDKHCMIPLIWGIQSSQIHRNKM